VEVVILPVRTIAAQLEAAFQSPPAVVLLIAASQVVSPLSAAQAEEPELAPVAVAVKVKPAASPGSVHLVVMLPSATPSRSPAPPSVRGRREWRVRGLRPTCWSLVRPV